VARYLGMDTLIVLSLSVLLIFETEQTDLSDEVKMSNILLK